MSKYFKIEEFSIDKWQLFKEIEYITLYSFSCALYDYSEYQIKKINVEIKGDNISYYSNCIDVGDIDRVVHIWDWDKEDFEEFISKNNSTRYSFKIHHLANKRMILLTKKYPSNHTQTTIKRMLKKWRIYKCECEITSQNKKIASANEKIKELKKEIIILEKEDA